MQHLYNITTLVSHPIAVDWLNWMQKEHIPGIMSSGCFLEFRLLRLKDHDETEGITYSLQLLAKSRDVYEAYLEKYAPALREETRTHWGEKAISFRTLLEVVN